MIGEKVILKKLMTVEQDGHYLDYLINGSRMVDYFGDITGELLSRATGDGSLFRAYKEINFLAPVYVGDMMQFEGWIEKKGKTSYEVHFRAYKIETHTDDYKVAHQFSHAKDHPVFVGYEGKMLCDPPLLCADAIGTLVVLPENYSGPLDPRFAVEE